MSSKSERIDSVYILCSSVSPNIVLDLQAGATEDGTPCRGWAKLDTVDTFSQQWLLIWLEGSLCMLQNLRSGTYLDLRDGSSENGTQVQGRARATGSDAKNQQWRKYFAESGSTDYIFINEASGTYLSLGDANPVSGTKVQGWKYTSPPDAPAQHWSLHCVSRRRSEIEGIIRCNAHTNAKVDRNIIDPNHNGSYDSNRDGLFIVLSESLRNEIYSATGLRATGLRKKSSECQDFAVIARGEVTKWGNNILRLDGVSILFGVMFGINTSGGSAYNWYLNKDLNEIMFFNPQNGTETLDPGYKGNFTLF